jgi:hypothetical protein
MKTIVGVDEASSPIKMNSDAIPITYGRTEGLSGLRKGGRA